MPTHDVKLIADIAVAAENSVLLVSYGEAPDAEAGWFLPGDELRPLEHPRNAARSILKEHVGLASADVRLSGQARACAPRRRRRPSACG